MKWTSLPNIEYQVHQTTTRTTINLVTKIGGLRPPTQINTPIEVTWLALEKGAMHNDADGTTQNGEA